MVDWEKDREWFRNALLVLVIVGAVSYDSTTKLIDSAEWVRQHHGSAEWT